MNHDEIPVLRDRAVARLQERGRRLCREGRCREALACFDRALELVPDHPVSLFWAGQERLHLGDYGLAETYLSRAWEQDPQLVGCARLLARLWLEQLHRPDRAEEFLRSARQLHPEHPGLLKAEGELRLALHEPARACELFDQVLRADPQDDEARDGLAMAYNELAYERHQQGETEQAIFLLRRALAITPDWSGLHVNLGQLFQALGRDHAALKEFLLGVREDPLDPIACFNLARLYRQLDEYTLAMEWFRRTLELDDNYPDARPELASLLYEQGDHAAAVRLLDEEVLRDPVCPVCHHNLGLALQEVGRRTEARTHLQRAVELDPAYFRAHYNLAALLAGSGEVRGALDHLQTAHRLSPDRTREWLELDRGDFTSLFGNPALQAILRTPNPGAPPDP